MQTREDQWLAGLYRDTFPAAASTVRQLGGDLHTAKDLFHDALIIYLEKCRRQAPDIRTSPKAYISGIVRILWMKKFRNDMRHEPLDNMEDIPEDFYTPLPAKEKRLLQYLKAAGEKCMQLLQAFYYEQLSMPEIAGRFGYRTPHSATVQKYKCLEKIREQVKQSDAYEEATT